MTYPNIKIPNLEIYKYAVPTDFLNIQKALLKSVNLGNIANQNVLDLANKLSANAVNISKLINSSGFNKVIEDMSRETPYNYADLMINQQFQLIEISRNNNFGTVEILTDKLSTLLVASSGDPEVVDEILLNNKEDIFRVGLDLVEAFEEVEFLGDFTKLFELAIASVSDGHYVAGQTLSTAIWDSFVSEKIGRINTITKVKNSYRIPIIEELKEFSALYDYGAYGPVISAYSTDGESSKYSRNGTVHHLSLKNANELNAIKSLTIAGGVLGRAWRSS